MARSNPKRKKCFDDVRSKLIKMNYGLVGETSAVQICRWTKNSLRGEGGCWKEKFYGIKSSGCVQMSPAVMWCENKCLHCWRPIEMNLGAELPGVDDPIEILDGIIAKRREMLMGMKGNKEVDASTFEEDITPTLFTTSLSGEPTLYPRLGEMFAEIRRRGAVSFLVTNGLNPSALRDLEKTGLPTQLVISCNAPNEELFLKWHRSSVRNAWEKFNESLDVMRELKGKVRRVVRLTLVGTGEEGEFCGVTNMTDSEVGCRESVVEGEDGEGRMIDEYVSLIRKADPDFVHVKGYKSVGFARDRMGYDNQVWHGEVLEFAQKLLERLNASGIGEAQSDDWKGSLRGGLVKYSVRAEDERSCVVCVAKDDVEMKILRV